MIQLGDEHRVAMGLGLSGAHRTGKTTVAAQLAEVNKVPFIASSTTAIGKAMGLKIDVGMRIEDRMAFQEEVLRQFVHVYETEAGNGFFVADRTPLDMAAYLLTDWRLGETTPEQDEWAMDYVARCMAATERWFYMVAVIQPGLPYVTGDGKPAPNELYQEFMNTVLVGLASDHRVRSHFYLMPRAMVDLGQRKNALAQTYSTWINGYKSVLTSNLPVQ